jgi:hypothetical protein
MAIGLRWFRMRLLIVRSALAPGTSICALPCLAAVAPDSDNGTRRHELARRIHVSLAKNPTQQGHAQPLNSRMSQQPTQSAQRRGCNP